MPSIAELPSLFNLLRHPRKSRSISVGPQSEADAYETLAYRAKRRRQSKSDSKAGQANVNGLGSLKNSPPDYFGMTTSNSISGKQTAAGLPTPANSNLDLYNSITGAETAIYTPLTPGSLVTGSASSSRRPSAERRQDEREEREEREMFSKLEKPRVRYDVEVITKLIVYTGIAWISVEGAPILFQTIGLGLEVKPG